MTSNHFSSGDRPRAPGGSQRTESSMFDRDPVSGHSYVGQLVVAVPLFQVTEQSTPNGTIVTTRFMQLIPVSVTSSRFDSDNGNPFRARDPPEEANVAQGRILPILDAVHDDIESRESESLRHEMERVRALGADFGTEAAQHVVPTSQEEDCPTRAKVGTLGDLTSAEELRGSLSQVERGFASSLQQHLWSQGWRNTSPEYEVFSTAAVQSFQNQLDRAKKAANADRFGTSAFGQLTPQSSAGARDFTTEDR